MWSAWFVGKAQKRQTKPDTPLEGFYRVGTAKIQTNEMLIDSLRSALHSKTVAAGGARGIEVRPEVDLPVGATTACCTFVCTYVYTSMYVQPRCCSFNNFQSDAKHDRYAAFSLTRTGYRSTSYSDRRTSVAASWNL